MLEIKNLSIVINFRTIINNLSFTINKNDKMAIIGEEGNGKSTLLKVIFGDCDYAEVTGTINNNNKTIGYLEQNLREEYLNISVMEYLFNDQQDYYFKMDILYKVLDDLKLNANLLEVRLIKKLSGGEKVKIQLLKILLNNPDILILDEPTNDLDIETLNWLEEFINNTNNPIIFVSHDETLLSKTANMILHLELLKRKSESKYSIMRMGYDEYISRRTLQLNKTTQISKKEKDEFEKQTEKLTKIRNKVEHQQNIISRSDPHGAKMLKRKMKSIKSQENRIRGKELTEIPDYEESINYFFDPVEIPNRKEILKLDIDTLKVENRILAENIKLDVIGPEKVVIIGKNGVGKTTLLKQIYKTLVNRQDIIVGYMPQNYDEVLNEFETPIDFLINSGDKEEISLIRSYMGNMKFTREEMAGKITDLSGGSKAKLILLKFILKNCNVLILDEPTRNISPLSNPVIRKSLIDFKGVIISISHDRKYIKEVCNSIYIMTVKGLEKSNHEL